MSSRSKRSLIAVVASFALVAAACGDDDDGDSSEEPAAEEDDGGEEATDDTEAETDDGGEEATDDTEAETDDGGEEATDDTEAETDDGAGEAAGSAGCPEIDTSLDAEYGVGAGRFMSDLQCSLDSPLAAEGEPLVVAVQNPEGDPNGSFPEYSLAMEAAAEYINAELGGLGADIQNGVPGRPIEVVVCEMAISPDDSQRCANELLSENPFFIFSTINFFGNQFPIYDAAGASAAVITPITVGDFTSANAFSIGGGGGCLGVHTGLVEFATTEFGDVQRVGVPWADTPPGVVCYYDLERKPLEVLAGNVEGASERAGTMPDLEHIGVPVLPATPDVTPQVTEILDFEPDVIIFSAQGADCWNFVDGLGRLGWTPDSIPLVLSGACIDFEAMRAAGDLANGIYFIGSSSAVTTDPELIEDERDRFDAEIYQSKPLEYGLPEEELFKGFATQGFSGMMVLWQLASQIAVDGGELTSEAVAEAFATTENTHAFASTPLSCATAPAPYVAVCNATVSATQWDGNTLVPVRGQFDGLDLIAGTEITPGP